MKTAIKTALRMVVLVVAALSLTVVGEVLAQRPADPDPLHPGLTARLTLAGGGTQTINFEGVGCPVAICSRVVIKSRGKGKAVTDTKLDSLAAIKDTTETGAVFVGKDGTERRLSVVPNNRYLYFTNADGVAGKVEMGEVKSLEFREEASGRERVK